VNLLGGRNQAPNLSYRGESLASENGIRRNGLTAISLGYSWLFLLGIFALLIRVAALARSDLTFQTGWDAADYIPLALGIQHGCGFAKFINGHCMSAEVLRLPGYPSFIAVMPGLLSVLVKRFWDQLSASGLDFSSLSIGVPVPAYWGLLFWQQTFRLLFMAE